MWRAVGFSLEEIAASAGQDHAADRFAPLGSLRPIPLKSRTALWAGFLSILILAFLPSCMRMRSSSPGSESSGLGTGGWQSDPQDTGLEFPSSIQSISERKAEGAVDPQRLPSILHQLPLSFIPNRGQVDERVRFYGRNGSAGFFFARDEVVYAFVQREEGASLRKVSRSIPGEGSGRSGEEKSRGHVMRLRFVGANPDPVIEGQQELTGKVNYFIGNDPGWWRRNLPTYGQVRYRELWPGIDLIYRRQGSQLKYEFIVKPGANPRRIRLAYRGIEGMSISDAGDLILKTASGELHDGRPYAYQEIGGRRVEVGASFRVDKVRPPSTDGSTGRSKLALHWPLQGASGEGPTYVHGFEVKGHDPAYPLILDPGLEYATFLGGSGEDWGLGIALDAAGNAYVTGRTYSSDFPTTAGAFDTSYNGGDAFAAKLSADGSTLLYATFLGGGSRDECNGIAVDANGNAYVTGETFSSDFPVTAGAFDTSGNNGDAFVAKLSPDGSALLYATFLGGTIDFDAGFRITLDGDGNTHVVGMTYSSDFPTTAGAFDTSFNGSIDAFVAKLSRDGSRLLYATFLGGSSYDYSSGIALDANGNAYVTGSTSSSDFPTTAGAFDTSFDGSSRDAFVVKLSPDGSTLLYATFLGGNRWDVGPGIAVDANGNAYVTGLTSSSDFPTTAGAFEASFDGGGWDAFVVKLSPDGSRLLYATFLGGNRWDEGSGIAVDANGNAFVTGQTSSPDFTTTPGAFDRSFNGSEDAFVAKLSPDGSRLLYATFLGGGVEDYGSGIALDASGNAYVTGRTYSSDFPTTAGAFDTSFNATVSLHQPDAFIAKIPITDTDVNPGTLQFSAVTYSAPENGSAVITVTRRNGRDGEVTIDFATSDGTATADSDYVLTSGTLTFADGETSKSFAIPIIVDTVEEGNETINLTLSNVGGGATLGVRNAAELTIIEAGTLQFSAATYSAMENGDAIITVTRTAGRRGEVTVDFATSDGTATAGSDYTHTSGTLIFADGETSASFTVPILNNALMEGDKTVNLTLSSPTGGATLGSPSTAVLTIIDDDVYLPDYFPATPGDTWTYRMDSSLTATRKVLPKTASVNGVKTKVFLLQSEDGVREKLFYTIDDQGIHLHRLFLPNVRIEGLGRVNLTATASPPIRWADAVMEIGQTVTSSGTIQTNPLPRVGVQKIPYSASFAVLAVDQVTVPAGNFDVMRLQGEVNASGYLLSFTLDLAKKIGLVKGTETIFGITTTLELTATNVGAHDLAVTKITVPKKITLTAGGPPKTALVKVELQNRSPHDETIRDLAMLDDLVTLAVERWGPGTPCSPAPTLLLPSGSPQKPLPLTLKPKQKLTVAFEVTFACANDLLASSARDPNHWDYRYTARVNHAALDGEADTHSEDDVCPRTVVAEPNPDGTIQDVGCGNKKTDGTLGAEVLTDVVVRWGWRESAASRFAGCTQ